MYIRFRPMPFRWVDKRTVPKGSETGISTPGHYPSNFWLTSDNEPLVTLSWRQNDPTRGTGHEITTRLVALTKHTWRHARVCHTTGQLICLFRTPACLPKPTCIALTLVAQLSLAVLLAYTVRRCVLGLSFWWDAVVRFSFAHLQTWLLPRSFINHPRLTKPH